MAKIKKGDLVQVISGAKEDRGGDRGKQGREGIAPAWKALEYLFGESGVGCGDCRCCGHE